MAIRDAVESTVTVVHPLDPGLRGLCGTIFTGPSTGTADLRNVTVFADAEVDRSPCGMGTSAVMAVLAAMGLLPPGGTFTRKHRVHGFSRPYPSGHCRRRSARDHSGDRRVSVDHRRAHLLCGRRGSFAGRLPPVLDCELLSLSEVAQGSHARQDDREMRVVEKIGRGGMVPFTRPSTKRSTAKWPSRS